MNFLIFSLVLACVVPPSPFLLSHAQEQKIFLEIMSPEQGSSVERRPRVKGKVSRPFTEVWVIVHALETTGYWVQPKTTIKALGDWGTVIFLGKEGMLDVGKEFELMAVANPRDSLDEGMRLPSWPRAEGKSEVITVIRR